ncbi:CRISPR-associated protein Cas1 [Methanomicrobium sp. W14]|uniref:CRISPR-associated endonuclease Cas1 n=1 Tax=Methanomicrobium sp. W14 TaxID=2817839 RepID=UPI001AE3C58F|nr:CRISPR-associated endonuclease Cas1 [Methanomicrobium sp. W14]MBP2133624.1 CRISPR-associated protein Cas1 [Methanomicrobium sp. W14]
MDLVINTWGSFLKKKGNLFLIKTKEGSNEIAADKINTILITGSAGISSDAVELALSKNIDIVFLDKYGNPYGRVWHSKFGSTNLIRRIQIEAGRNRIGTELSKEWMNEKINNQIGFIKYLKKNRPKTGEIFDDAISFMSSFPDKINALSGTPDEIRGTVMGYEGSCSKKYFEVLSTVMTDTWKFNGRSRNPAKDGFNCLLNYGYGMLYSVVEKSCIISGLDPFAGFLHVDNYNKMSFVFDLIEKYRIFIDVPVVFLFTKKMVSEDYFDEIPGGLYLNADGKKAMIAAINQSLEEKISYSGKNMMKKNIIRADCHNIANRLLKYENEVLG